MPRQRLSPEEKARRRRAWWRRYYRAHRKERIAYVGNWYRTHPDVARRMEKTKWSQAPGAREARALRAWWRDNWPSCSQCGSRITVAEISGRSISFCPMPEHGFAWTWDEEALFWTAAPASARTWERRRRNGTATTGALKAWATRRARGRVSEDARKAWKARREKFGASGLSPEGITRMRVGARDRAVRRWKDPAYRERQLEKIRSGIARQKTGATGEVSA